MVCILANGEIKKNKKYMKRISDFFTDQNIMCYVANTEQDNFGNYIFTGILPETKLLIALGGDGTMLQASSNASKMNIPLLGFNTGTLGFLSENKVSKLEETLTKLCNKECFIEERMMIKAFKETKYIESALNDIVITREGFSRIVSMKTIVGNTTLNEYRGDGLVISTPTGSTGYNLSLGGPLVSPKASNIILTPIACHTLLSRPIILDANEEIDICILKSRKTQEKEAILTVDGRRNIDLHAGDTIRIKASNNKVKLLKMERNNFFEICNKKLK